MPITAGELEFAKVAAEMAEAILPKLRDEEAELSARIRWHESNLAAWNAMRPEQEPNDSALLLDQLIAESPRARRGEAEDRVLRLMRAHPGIKAKDIHKALREENGVTYPLSTIYRIINLVKEQSKTPASTGVKR